MTGIVWLLLITNWHTPVELGSYQSEATCIAASKQIYTYTKGTDRSTVYTTCVPLSNEGRIK